MCIPNVCMYVLCIMYLFIYVCTVRTFMIHLCCVYKLIYESNATPSYAFVDDVVDEDVVVLAPIVAEKNESLCSFSGRTLNSCQKQVKIVANSPSVLTIQRRLFRKCTMQLSIHCPRSCKFVIECN